MMKRFVVLSVLMAGMAMIGACSMKQELEYVEAVDNKVLITASFPETRISLSEGENALDLAWSEDDYLTVVSGDVREKYEMVSFSGNVATFTGNPVEGESYDILLSYSGEEYLDRSYVEQNQSTVTSSDHLSYDAVLKGVNDYNAVCFTSDWAEAHGGELLQSGCLLMHFQLPEDVGYIKSVTLQANEPVFFITNYIEEGRTDALTLTLDNADMQSDNVVKAYFMTSMIDATIPEDAEFTLTVVSDLGTWSKNFEPGASVIQSGKKNIIKLNSKNWTCPVGDGSQQNPYILRTAADLEGLSSKLGTSMKYVAMVNDIDASSISTWKEISYTKLIDFNGNNRTISNFKPSTFNSDYAGFIAVLNGRVANLNIVGAEVTGKDNKACGILAGYMGRSNGEVSGEIENVHVEGTVSGTGKGVGGMVGILGSGTISRSSANVNVSGTKDNVGGLVGYFNDGGETNICEISDCWTSGAIKGDTQKIAGIIGELFGNATYNCTNPASIKNCYSTASVEGLRAVGGIVAYAYSSEESTSVVDCIAWNDRIAATGTKYTQHSSGAVVGKTQTFHTLKDCFRRPDIEFSCSLLNKDANAVVAEAYVCDQENVDSENKLTIGTYDQEGTVYMTNSCNNWYPYHGKAAAAGATVSSVARSLGWDDTIWDLSGALPRLIR